VLAGHSFGGLLALTFAAEYPQDVAGVVLLDSTHPEMFTRLSTYPAFFGVFRRAVALFPSLARFGIARWVNHSSFDSLPPADRDVERALASTPRQARSVRDEWVEAPELMKQAQALETLGNRPLIVVTAGRDAQAGWLPLQDDLARLSTNSAHRTVADASHMSLIQSRTNAALASQAIRDVVDAVRKSAVVRGS
jgi:pimeloyl-ACP methyl ester carboxylesterase